MHFLRRCCKYINSGCMKLLEYQYHQRSDLILTIVMIASVVIFNISQVFSKFSSFLWFITIVSVYGQSAWVFSNQTYMAQMDELTLSLTQNKTIAIKRSLMFTDLSASAAPAYCYSYGVQCDLNVGSATFGSVTGINLANEGLTGSLPDSIGYLTALVTLNLGNNLLTGNLPITLYQLNNLNAIDVSNNYLTMSTGLKTFSDVTLFGDFSIGGNCLTFNNVVGTHCAPSFAVHFRGCADSVLQAQSAITFAGEPTYLTGNIGIAPGTAITAEYVAGHLGVTHRTDTYAAICAADTAKIAAQAAGQTCQSIPSELGKMESNLIWLDCSTHYSDDGLV